MSAVPPSGTAAQTDAHVRLIDKASPIPYYQQLADLLRHEISRHQHAPGVYRLPSENELAERHGISRATVRHALDVLARDGWIYREKGKGSFAAVRRVEQEATQLVSTTEDMQRRGWSLTTRVIALQQLPAPSHVAYALEIDPGAPVYELCRLRIVNHEPLSVQTTYLPQALCPALEENDLSLSLFRLLETRYGLRLWTARSVLRARLVTAYEAHLLQVSEQTPVLYMERITYAATGIPVEYLEAVWRGDRYDMRVTLHRTPPVRAGYSQTIGEPGG
ncbi:MAG: GntR family transcriptional regulator [Anaerolineae bacterium]|nr:GntR family transcriptional regulator [Anaerolineae bacterium]MDW8070694.1 GntR family transcriptional regulator [Anaerolineae bacterium]